MEALIPDKVIAHLRQLIEQQEIDPLQGGFTIEQYEEALGVSKYRARKDIKTLFRAGLIEPRTIGLTFQQALQMGITRACAITVYHLTDDVS